ELLLLDERSEDDREALEIIQREAARAGRIVSDLRLVARQKQDTAAHAASLHLGSLVERTIRAIGPDLHAAGVRLEVDLHPDLPPVYGVSSQLERVVGQLLSNAFDALRERPEPRSIRVSTHPTAMGSALRVRDTGPGIPPEHIDHIFDPFWTSRQAGQGTGLGLSLLHSIVSDHNGRVHVDGGWREGATFTVEFPSDREARIAAPAAVAHLPSHNP